MENAVKRGTHEKTPRTLIHSSKVVSSRRSEELEKTLFRRWMLVFMSILLGTFVVSLLIGRYPSPGLIAPRKIFSDELAFNLVFSLRLPRVVVALLLGAVLAACGNVFQMIFGNPLVEPGFMGVSQGAAFGAALSIIFFGNVAVIIQSISAVFAFSGLVLSYYLAKKLRFGGWILRLILAGISVSALFSSGLGILKYMADPLSELPEITFWLMGGIWGVTWGDVKSILPLVIPGLFVLYKMRWRINLLSLDERVAFTLGVSSVRERAFILLVSAAITAAVISVSGIVAWIGLIIPHLARRLVRADARYSLPASMILGAIFLMICDDLARTLLPGEIPLGVFTSLFGAGFFIILLTTKGVKKEK